MMSAIVEMLLHYMFSQAGTILQWSPVCPRPELPRQNELSTIGGHIKNNTAITPIIYEETSIKELIHLRWLFFLIIGLLALEWFIRKRNGAY